MKSGIEGCGLKTAVQLSRTELGHRLFDIVGKREANNSIDLALQEWRQDLKVELATNRSGVLSSKHPKLALNISDTFPDLEVVDLYVHPKVRSDNLNMDAQSSLCYGSLDVIGLAKFAEIRFDWGENATSVLSHYESHLFPVLAFRQLIEAANDISFDRISDGSGCPMIGKIVGERQSRETCFLPEYRVMLIIPDKVVRAICAFQSQVTIKEKDVGEAIANCSKFRAWLPCAMLKAVRPDLVAVYNTDMTKSKGQKTVQNGNVLTYIIMLKATDI